MKKVFFSFLLALTLLFAMSITAFAAEDNDTKVIDNVMQVGDGSYNVWVYGKCASIAGGNITDIVPNNESGKIDVMINGSLYKQLNGVIIIKDSNKDRVYLEAGSSVIEAPNITESGLSKLKKDIAAGKLTSVATAQALGSSADTSAFAYQIAENGKIISASGEDMAALLKTNANYKSAVDAFNEAIATANEKAREASEEAARNEVTSSEVTEYIVFIAGGPSCGRAEPDKCKITVQGDNHREASGDGNVYYVSPNNVLKVSLEYCTTHKDDTDTAKLYNVDLENTSEESEPIKEYNLNNKENTIELTVDDNYALIFDIRDK